MAPCDTAPPLLMTDGGVCAAGFSIHSVRTVTALLCFVFYSFPSYFFQTIQILCFLVISSLGVILVSAPNSSQLSPAISSILMTGYPFLGALCVSRVGSPRGDMLYKCQLGAKSWNDSIPRSRRRLSSPPSLCYYCTSHVSGSGKAAEGLGPSCMSLPQSGWMGQEAVW